MVGTRSGSSSSRKPTPQPSIGGDSDGDGDGDTTRAAESSASASASASSAAAAASREKFLRRLEREQRRADMAAPARPRERGGEGTEDSTDEPQAPQGKNCRDGEFAAVASDPGTTSPAGGEKEVPRGNSDIAKDATGILKASQDPKPSAKDTPQEVDIAELESDVESTGAADRRVEGHSSEDSHDAVLLEETPIQKHCLDVSSQPEKQQQHYPLQHQSQQEDHPKPVSNNATNQDILSYLSHQCGLEDAINSQPPIDLDRDVDPSSLAFLRGLASVAVALNSEAMDANGNIPSCGVAAASSSTHNAPSLSMQRVSTPKVTDVGKTIAASTSLTPVASSSTANNPGETSAAGNSHGGDQGIPNNDESAAERRIIHLLERQLAQMQEMQARIDAMGSMMARMEREVSRLRNDGERAWYDYNNNIGDPTDVGVSAIRRYGRMGGLLGRDGQPWPREQLWPSPNGTVWRRGQRDGSPAIRDVTDVEATRQPHPPREINDTSTGPLPEGWMEVYDPYSRHTHYYHEATNMYSPVPPGAALHPPQQRPQPTAETPSASAAPDGANAAEVNQTNDGAVHPQFHRGIFFPLFVSLYHFILSLPQRLRGLLLDSGPGRVYAHLRDRAIERRAFANVDVSALIKLMVMMLIITGRMSGGGGGRGVRDRRRVVQQQQQRQQGDDDDGNNDEDDGLTSLLYSLLQMIIDFWNGHRTHTLFMAAIIAFLIQVGLMPFFYQVIWVERDELFRVWMGWENENDELEGDDVGSTTDGDVGDQNNDNNDNNDGQPAQDAVGDAAQPAEPNINAAARQRPQPRPAGAAPPAALARGMFRRGPNNGGVIHDVQCLILSFLLSLIPAWKPEEAAPPTRPLDGDDRQQQQQRQVQGQEAVE